MECLGIGPLIAWPYHEVDLPCQRPVASVNLPPAPNRKSCPGPLHVDLFVFTWRVPFFPPKKQKAPASSHGVGRFRPFVRHPVERDSERAPGRAATVPCSVCSVGSHLPKRKTQKHPRRPRAFGSCLRYRTLKTIPKSALDFS